MNLSTSQLKKSLIPIGADRKDWTSLVGSCLITASLYDILNSYIASVGFNIVTDQTLKGLGTQSSKLGLASQGATVGQVLTYNGTSWVPATPAFSAQTLTFNDPFLSISGGNTVNLSSLIPDPQTLSIVGYELTISNGNTINLPAEWQTLSIEGDQLTIGPNGNTVTLPATTGGTIPQIWKWNANNVVANPGSGKIGANNDNLSLATSLFIHYQTDDGTDMTPWLRSIQVDDELIIWTNDNVNNYLRVKVSSTVIDNTFYFQIPFTSVAYGGTEPTNNTDVRVALLGGTSSAGYNTISLAGGPYAQRNVLNFVNSPTFIITDDSLNNATNVALAANLVQISLISPTSGATLYFNGTSWAQAIPVKNVQTGMTGTIVTLPSVPISNLPTDVYLNGVLKEEAQDYTISSNTINFTFNLVTSDKVTTKYFN